ncbi:MAG: hypothetical protein Q4F05_10835 [bacterium]|nr:hypothetical protein [bacterium]
MKNNYVLSVIVKVSPETTDKKFEKTLQSIYGKLSHDVVQVIVEMAEEISELKEVLNEYTDKVEIVSEVSSCDVKGSYLNVLEAGEYWEGNSLPMLMEQMEAGEAELISACGEAGIHYIVNEASNAMMDIAPLMIQSKYKEQVLSLIQAEPLERLLGITSLCLQAKTYLSLARCSVKYKKTVLTVEEDWYTGKLGQFAKTLNELSVQLYGTEIYYVQNIIMNLISSCLKNKLHKELSEEEQQDFVAFLKERIMVMNDMIISKGGLNAALRMYVFELKYGEEIWNELQYRKGRIMFRNLLVFNLNNAYVIKKIQKKKNGDQTDVFLTINNPLEQKFTYLITDDAGEVYPLEKDTEVMEKPKAECFGKVLTKEVVYKATVPTSILDTIGYEYRFMKYNFGRMQMKEKV